MTVELFAKVLIAILALPIGIGLATKFSLWLKQLKE